MMQNKIKVISFLMIVFVNYQEFGHTTSLCPSGNIFTLIKEEVICDKIGELVDCKDLPCMNQCLFLEDDVSTFSCSIKGDCHVKSLFDENAQGKPSEQNIKELVGLGALEI